MIQNIIIIIILAACGWFIGRRIYANLKGTQQGCGCGCSGCDEDIVSSCQTTDYKSESE